MSYMELKTLPEHIFHAPRELTSINLTGNLFKTLPQALEYAINLVELVMDENPIEEFSRNKYDCSLRRNLFIQLNQT